ncbi:MAG: DEAD/DEAH box helicase [Oscillospiraceae bacterium]|nr:DEAD/DEAH box helicase [Oscillospiraceae bacterium]
MIRQILGGNPEYIEKILSQILNRIHTAGPVHIEDFESLAYIKMYHNEIFMLYEQKLLYLMGLFYKVERPKNLVEELYAIFADSILEDTKQKFTPVQAEAYKYIENKKYFSFSAPTSAGKSYLFRELILKTNSDIVIVVPSRALIAEYLEMVKKLVPNSVLVLQFIENVNIKKTSRRVYIITPERGQDLFRYKDSFNIELFLFDEAQLSEEEIRGIGFDAFVRRTAKEFPSATHVFAHPFVKNPEAQLSKHHFDEQSIAATYTQNAVGKIFVCRDNKKFHFFSPFENPHTKILVKVDFIEYILKSRGSILIYTSKRKLYSGEYLHKFYQYLKLCPYLTDLLAIKYVEELKDYIGASDRGKKVSMVARLMERGIVVHHGSMPLRMRLIIEQFVRAGFAKICFATSTLNQGINMPFDVVYIDNFRSMDVLTLKNLIGRAGRATDTSNFDYGYTIINKRNIETFSQRMNEVYELSSKSKLDESVDSIEEDYQDIVEATKNNTFDIESRLTHSQIERIRNSDIDNLIKYILDNLLLDGRVLTGHEYYSTLTESRRRELKDCFKDVYISHLRRAALTRAEQSVLSTAIPILLWHIQGKTFKEVLSLRHSYLTRMGEQRDIEKQHKNGDIPIETKEQLINNLKIRYSPTPDTLPNKQLYPQASFGNDEIPVTEMNYDLLVFDTYDYIDKVVSLSLSDPLYAAFKQYYETTTDIRALSMCNYIRYGTDDSIEIWLLRYGLSFEDIAWLKPFVLKADEQEIVFSSDVQQLEQEKTDKISRYL